MAKGNGWHFFRGSEKARVSGKACLGFIQKKKKKKQREKGYLFHWLNEKDFTVLHVSVRLPSLIAELLKLVSHCNRVLSQVQRLTV